MTLASLDHHSDAFQMHQHLVAGRYRTYKRIGKGRLGDIFAAVDESYNALGVQQHLAIQVISRDIAGNNRLFNKLSVGYTMLKAAAHPNIVQYQSFGRDGKFGFLTMELLEGGPLSMVLDGAETLPENEVKTVIRSIGEALSLLHAKDLVHGNLTTANIFVTDELRVRLLDVLPLDADDAIFRGAAMSDPAGRCTVEDDVFGLACLTYEMLAGKHPFNYSSPGEARMAGLEAERIASLSERDWHALRRALSFERYERQSTIAEFLREFGVSGTERLRPTPEAPREAAPEQEVGSYAAAWEAPPLAEPYETDESPGTAGIDGVFEPAPKPLRREPALRLEDIKPDRMRAGILGIALAALVAWIWFGQPEERMVDAIGYVDESMDLGLTVPEDGIVNAPAEDADDPVMATEDPVVEDTPPVADTPDIIRPLVAQDAATIEESPAATVGEEEIVPAAQTTEEIILGEPLATAEPLPPVEESAPLIEERVVASSPAAAAPPAPARDTAPPAPQPEAIVVPSAVSVSEGDSAARIQLQVNTSPGTQLTWWTSDDTAVADRDYIGAKQRVLTNEMLADGSVLHVPLINDNTPEGRETFYVTIGRRDSVQQKIEMVATVRVDIVDDDML